MEPVSIAAAVGGLGWVLKTAVEGALENWSDRGLSFLVVDLKNRLTGLRGLPANHDVARAIRTAQLQALHRTVCGYADLQDARRSSLLHVSSDDFADLALRYCTEGLRRVNDSGASLETTVSALVDAVDGILAVPGDDDLSGARANRLGDLAETSTLAELRTALGDREFPDGFETHFRTGTYDEKQRFLELFGAFISEALKENERFRHICVAGQLSGLRSLALDSQQLLTRLDDRFGGTLLRIESTMEDVRAAQAEHLTQLHLQGRMIADLHAVFAGVGASAWADTTRSSPPYRSSPDGAPSPRSDDVAAPTTVSNIPYITPRHFVGRDEDIERIERGFTRYAGRAAILAINGMRGSGKSTLAMAYAERHRRDYRATWWIRAATDDGIQADLVALAIALKWARPDEREDYPVAAVLDRVTTDGERILLIYDNAVDAETIEPYLPREGGAHVLITSNASAWRQVAEPIELRLWPNSVGAEFLIARTGHGHERDEAERLSGACEGLPLALEVAASYCEQVGISLAEYRRRFDREGVMLIDRGVSPRAFHDRLSVTKAFQLAIGEAAQRHSSAEPLIVHAALLAAEPIPTYVFDEGAPWFEEPFASSLEGGGLDTALGALRTFSLIDRVSIPDERQSSVRTDCIRLHRLVREIASLRWPEEARSSARGRLIAAMAHLYPPDDTYVVTHWWRARRLDPLAWGLVGDGIDLPPGSELPASDLMCRLGAYRHASMAAYAQARALYTRALAIREEMLGASHPSTAECLNSLALLSWAEGDLAGARTIAERALTLREASYGPDHPEVAQSLITLARILRERRELVAATALCHRALAIYEQTAGPDHPDSALCKSTLVRILLIDGNLREAEPLSRDAARIYERVLGADHPALAASLINLATVLQRQRRPAEACPHLERAVVIHEGVLGPVHPTVASSLFRLASALEEMGDYARARPLVERALDINVRTLGAEHPISVSVREHLEQLASAAG
jgi:tetratricopeptide (TPR) repeat protein